MATIARRRPTRRAVAVVAAAGVVAAAFALWLRDSSLVRVERVAVSGLAGGQAAEIEAALVDAARDMTTLHVRHDRLAAAVERYPIVKSMRADADFPHGLRIAVDAYEPVAALQPRSGDRVAVAWDGTLLRGAATRGLAIVGVRTAPGGDRVRDRRTLAAIALLADAPRALRDRVNRVYHAPRGLAVTVQDGPKLYFGGPSRLRAKWGAAAQVLAQAGARGASHVDVRVPERPVAGGLVPRPADSQPQL